MEIAIRTAVSKALASFKVFEIGRFLIFRIKLSPTFKLSLSARFSLITTSSFFMESNGKLVSMIFLKLLSIPQTCILFSLFFSVLGLKKREET